MFEIFHIKISLTVENNYNKTIHSMKYTHHSKSILLFQNIFENYSILSVLQFLEMFLHVLLTILDSYVMLYSYSCNKIFVYHLYTINCFDVIQKGKFISIARTIFCFFFSYRHPTMYRCTVFWVDGT